MLISEIKKIIKIRLGKWGIVLAENQSTPLVLIGVGHNSKSGKLHVCVCKEMSKSTVVEFLRGAADELDPEKKGGN